MAAIIPAVAVGVAVADELPKFFNDAFDQFSAGEGIYLRDGQPEGVVAQIGQAVGRAYCRLIDARNDSPSTFQAVRNERACRPYLNSIGSPGGPGLELPFRGGQCLCSVYSVRVDASWIDRGDQTTRTGFLIRRVRGPLLAATTFEGTGADPRVQFRFIANNVSENTSTNPACLAAGAATQRTFDTSQGQPVAGSLKATGVSLTLISGTDTCGNPAPVPTLPPVPVNPNPPPFRFNPKPGLDIDIDVQVLTGGNLTFNIGTGPITVDLFPDSDGGGGTEPGGDPPPPDGPSDGPPGDVGQPGSPQEPGEGGEASGCAPDGSVLVGVKVDFVEVPEGAKLYAPSVYRAVCYVYMGTLTGLDHDPAGAMMRSGQFVFAEKDNLTCWAVRANVGWSLRTTPYYREVEQ